MSKDIFEASRNGDLDFVKSSINRGVDLNKKNEFGFTALHCAAIGSNSSDKDTNLDIIKLLVEAGCDLETLGRGERTSLYLLAEFSPYLDQIEFLVNKGARADVYDEFGNHITKNAMTKEVQDYLSKLTNKTVIKEETPRREPIKLRTKDWKKATKELSKVFAKLNQIGLVAIQDIGYTQSDAFDDCTAEYHKRKDKENVKGFCFYTNQDSERAKDFGILPIGIWGATEGGETETIEVCEIVIKVLNENGFEVDWDGKSTSRPGISMHRFCSSKGLFEK